MCGEAKSTTTATAASLPLGTGPAWCGFITRGQATHIGGHRTAISVAWTSLASYVVWVLALEVSSSDDDDVDDDNDGNDKNDDNGDNGDPIDDDNNDGDDKDNDVLMMTMLLMITTMMDMI